MKNLTEYVMCEMCTAKRCLLMLIACSLLPHQSIQSHFTIDCYSSENCLRLGLRPDVLVMVINYPVPAATRVPEQNISVSVNMQNVSVICKRICNPNINYWIL